MSTLWHTTPGDSVSPPASGHTPSQRESMPSPYLRLQLQRPTSQVVVVQVAGDLDTATTPYLTELLAPRLASTAEAVVLDLSRVGFLGTAGLSLLMEARQRADVRGVALRLVTGPVCVERALRATGLTGQFALYSALHLAVFAPTAPRLDPVVTAM